MAKKPSSEPKLNVLIRNYASEIAELEETLHNPKLDFGYRFLFPNRKNPMHKPITIVKPKKKKYIEIGIGLSITGKHKDCLEKLDEEKKRQLFFEFQKIFFSKEVQFELDFKSLRFAFHKNIYFEGNSLSRVSILKTITKIFSIAMLTIILLEQFRDEKVDFSKRSFGPSIYT
ncbi:MAG: DUF2299 family protein [Candidatus Odinarchaeota archaeon]